MCESSTKRLYFFDYLGEEYEPPKSYYDKYPIIENRKDDVQENVYKIAEMKALYYGK